MARTALIAGGGIGGLAAALACARAGWSVRLFEQAAAFSEVGAGIQLGPNVVRVLQRWQGMAALESVAAFPQRLQVRDALSGESLGVLPLGSVMQSRYGAPYATIHRADLHGLLLDAVRQTGRVQLQTAQTVSRYELHSEQVNLHLENGDFFSGDLLVGADGLWSRVRTQLLQDAPPRVTGHLAYRALVQQAELPQSLRSQQITVWLGPRLHVVQYPVRRGEALNVVAIVHGHVQGGLEEWDHEAHAADLQRLLAGTASDLRDLVHAIPAWRLWVLCDRPPMRGPQQQAQGRVALLGDAAHPMRPYLAQGAGMALEDAAELGHCLGGDLNRDLSGGAGPGEVPAALARYAAARWARNARVQARSQRNGQIFHLQGPARWGRNLAMKLLGERLMDLPWLYRGPMEHATRP